MLFCYLDPKKSVTVCTLYIVYNYHMIVTRKIDGAQINHTCHIFSNGNTH